MAGNHFGITILAWAAALALPVTTSAAEWQASEQADLDQQLQDAQPLEVEQLGKPARAVGQFGVNLVPHRDAENYDDYDALVFYAQAYRTNERAYIVNLATGEAVKQDLGRWEGDSRVEMAFGWTYAFVGGKRYGATHGGSDEQINLFVYDPDVGRIELDRAIPNAGGERAPLAQGVDGAIYGAGAWRADDPSSDPRHRRTATAYRYDPATGEVRHYGSLGPNTEGNAVGYHMAVDDQYMYISLGQIPWYLLAVNIETGEDKVLAEAPEGSYTSRIWLRGHYGGGSVMVQKTDDPADQQHYWLYHGEMIPRDENDDTPPWPDRQSPREMAPPEPEIYRDQIMPDADNRAVLWYRAPQDQDRQGETPEQRGWRKVVFDHVETHPYKVHRLQVLPDGRLFGSAQGYYARFLFDPETDQSTSLTGGGTGTISIYDTITHGDSMYSTGYPSSPLYIYDPSREWTVGVGSPPGASEPEPNPQRAHPDQDVFFRQTRVKKMFSLAVGADGRIYFGGKGQRDYEGGGLAWYDPDTGETGGMWKPFDRDPDSIFWLTPALDDRYIVIATRGGKVFLYDTQSQQLTDRTITPVADPPVGSGPLVEVAPGRLLGTTYDPDGDGGIIYGIDLNSDEPVAFNKKVPAALEFHWTQGSTHWGYTLGPDGRVYTFLGDALVRIRPEDAHVQVLGRTSPGRMVFVGDDMYLAGEQELRRVRNIASSR